MNLRIVFQEVRERPKVEGTNTLSVTELKAKVQEFNLKDKSVLLLAISKVLFDCDVLTQIETYRNILLIFCMGNYKV